MGCLHSMVETSILLSGPAGEQREGRKRLLSQSNLCVVSVEGSDLLFQWNKKGNREFVTGYADEGAVTVSNPVHFALPAQSSWLPPLAACPAKHRHGKQKWHRLPAFLVLLVAPRVPGMLFPEGWSFLRVTCADLREK